MVAFIEPWHISNTALAEKKIRITGGGEGEPPGHPDYVVLHINSGLLKQRRTGTKNKPIFDLLDKHCQKAFSIRRTFDLEVVSAWKKKSSR